MYGWIHGWMDGCTDGYMNGWMDGRTDTWMDGRMDFICHLEHETKSDNNITLEVL